MSAEELTNDMITEVGGLRAVEMFYRNIREIETGSTSFFQSRTRLNTPGLGTLVPETFRGVAELSNQCISLFELELVQALDAIKKFQERDFFFRWLSVYMPVRFLNERLVENTVAGYVEETGIDSNRVCFELPSSLLTEGNPKVSRSIANLRNRGFHFMLSDFGGSNCPLMKLSEYPVDYVLLNQEITSYIGKSDRSNSAINSIVEFASKLGADSIADGVTNATQAEILFEASCSYVAGPLSGKYTLERYVRKKTEAIIKEE